MGCGVHAGGEDGIVSTDDLLILLASFGRDGQGDITGDDQTTTDDLLALLAAPIAIDDGAATA